MSLCMREPFLDLEQLFLKAACGTHGWGCLVVIGLLSLYSSQTLLNIYVFIIISGEVDSINNTILMIEVMKAMTLKIVHNTESCSTDSTTSYVYSMMDMRERRKKHTNTPHTTHLQQSYLLLEVILLCVFFCI